MVKMLSKKEKASIVAKKYHARRASIKEGMYNSAKMSFGNYYLSPFAIAINASNSIVAMLSALTGLLGPISQMFSSRLIGKYSRKKILTTSATLSALMWIPIIIIAILFHFRIAIDSLPLFLLLFFSTYTAVTTLGNPAWFSWAGDLISPKFRGRWFSKRNLIIGFVAAILAFIASIFLEYMRDINLIMPGFIVLFALALFFDVMRWHSFTKLYEPKFKVKKKDYFSFSDFLIKAPSNNFGRFAIFKALIMFSASISSPLVAVYLLRYLGFTYIEYMLVILANTLFAISLLELWGKIADRYGNYRVMALTTIIIPIIPILWILSDSVLYLILIPAAFGGIAWAGFNLSSINFVYDNVSAEKRALAVSYQSMLNGIGIFFGAGVGALLIKFLSFETIEPLVIIFLLGGLIRMIVVFFWLPKFKEKKKKKKFDSSKALKEIILKETRPTLLGEAHEIFSIPKYFK